MERENRKKRARQGKTQIKTRERMDEYINILNVFY